jgi:hypothetical protein
VKKAAETHHKSDGLFHDLMFCNPENNPDGSVDLANPEFLDLSQAVSFPT